MARKNLMDGLMNKAPTPATDPEATRVDVTRPRYATGAIGAVSQSISDLKSRAVQDVDAQLIDAAGLRDRLDEQGGLTELMGSIKEYGQQVPVLLRPHPDNAERFQIVYGRRRVAALRALGLPVKALVRSLDDRALIVAQGQENSARRDLSFIERVNFARQMRDMGYDRKVICDALHVDKTLISRMISVADRIAPDVIETIGAAPSVGRDRWLKLADLLAAKPDSDVAALAQGDTSDDRFEALLQALQGAKPASKPKPATALLGAKGQPLGQVKRSGSRTTLTLNAKQAEGFEDWLINNIQDLHARFKNETS
jgi:ParB family chromosome partitioning protein